MGGRNESGRCAHCLASRMIRSPSASPCVQTLVGSQPVFLLTRLASGCLWHNHAARFTKALGAAACLAAIRGADVACAQTSGGAVLRGMRGMS